MCNIEDVIRIQAMAKEIDILADKILSGNRTPIETLNLTSRAKNCLTRGDILYVEQLIKLDKNDLWRLRNMGKKTLQEIDEKLGKLCYTKP